MMEKSKLEDEESYHEEDGRRTSSIELDEELEPYIRNQRRSGSESRNRKPVSEEEAQVLRLKINSRERRRMHDLNSALDSLRQVMPYAQGANVRKVSKIATLLLAKNYILMLTQSLEEARRLLAEKDLPAPKPKLAFSAERLLASEPAPIPPCLKILSGGTALVPCFCPRCAVAYPPNFFGYLPK